MELWTHIAEQITAASGEPFQASEQHAVGGGCINSAYRIGDGSRRYFVKLNDASHGEMFAAEAAGLQALADSHTIRVPRPLCWGTADGQTFLVMENLALGGGGSMEELGRRLAALHRTTQSRYGWWRDNTIGSTPQVNTEETDWVEFWRRQRLGFQLELAARHGGGRLHSLGDKLLAELPALFSDYTPPPSLLHGDLWAGNYAFTSEGEPMSRDGRYAGSPGGSEPVIFDPAVYYGDREAEIAMTELFGGFGASFYAAYNEAWPLEPGYAVRKSLYNLYHVLNHYNMFGGGYGGQAERMMERLLSELR